VVVNVEEVYPFAYTVFAGRFTPVTVTGKEFGLVIVATTSPEPPGKSWLVAEGVATAVIVRLLTVADCPSPEDPAFNPTTQLVTPYAAPPTIAIPARPDTTLKVTERLLRRWKRLVRGVVDEGLVEPDRADSMRFLVVRFIRVCFIVLSLVVDRRT
jgi:hypothetical protein